MTRAVALAPIPDAAEFAPFGSLIVPPDEHGSRRFYSDWLGGGDGLAPVFHVNSVPETILPADITTLERHPHAAQCFVPLDVSRYLVVVAPDASGGGPDLAGLRAFVVPGTRGVIYRQGVWHAGARVLDGPGAFAVLMWRGSANDDEFMDIPLVTLLAKDLSQ